MPSIIEEVVEVVKVRFDPPSQGRGEKNSNIWRQECMERSSERAAKITNNNSLRQSNPETIPEGRKQTSARHASMRTIQRLIDDIQEEKNNLPLRDTEAGSIPIRCETDEELQRSQLAFTKQKSS